MTQESDKPPRLHFATFEGEIETRAGAPAPRPVSSDGTFAGPPAPMPSSALEPETPNEAPSEASAPPLLPPKPTEAEKNPS
jgi:hypothetical protein